MNFVVDGRGGIGGRGHSPAQALIQIEMNQWVESLGFQVRSIISIGYDEHYHIEFKVTCPH